MVSKIVKKWAGSWKVRHNSGFEMKTQRMNERVKLERKKAFNILNIQVHAASYSKKTQTLEIGTMALKQSIREICSCSLPSGNAIFVYLFWCEISIAVNGRFVFKLAAIFFDCAESQICRGSIF